MKKPDISIVVSNWNSSDILEEALDSIVSTGNDLNFDVTVIDDASTDGGIAEIAERFKDDDRFTFIVNKINVGQAALNIMLESTQAKYIVTLDSDARLKPGALQAMFAFMETHPEAGAVTANLLNPDGSTQFYYRRILTPSLYFFTTPIGRFFDKYFLGLRNMKQYHYDDLDLSHDPELEQPPIACLMLRHEALGPYIFDPIFRLFMLDVDLSKRLYDHGYKVFLVSDAKVIHLKTVSASKRGKVWLDRELNRSFFLYLKKNYPYSTLAMWFVWMLDRVLRTILLRTIGHEPMR
ncbi:MAG: glycosyltransferase [Candidatus Paceibacterota bacterium]